MSAANRIGYCQYLLSSQINYTLTNFADHFEGLSHDKINHYLRNDKLSPKLVWEHVKGDIIEPSSKEDGYILFDDTVIDKDFSFKIESVRKQYSGNTHGIIKGIGVVTCVYVNKEINKFWIIDFRIFDPDRDGKNKIDHVKEMLNHAQYSKQILFNTVLIDSWYSAREILLMIDQDLQKTYYCPLKKNRLVNDTGKDLPPKAYTKIEKLEWSEKEKENGKIIAINKFPKSYQAKLFLVTVSNNRIEHVLTNDMSQNSSDDTRKECAVRWKIEEFHREAKQLTGIEKCQCRKNRIQRNHIACAMLVWVKLTKVANETKKTIYQVKHSLLDDYLIEQLKSPVIRFA